MEHERGWHETWVQPQLSDHLADVDDLVITALVEQSERRAAERDAYREERDVFGRRLSALQLAYDALQERADYDPLTGLQKHDVWEQKMDAYLQAGKTIAVFMIDLDNFKAVNDEYGHAEGDNVLIAVSQGLRRAFGRESDELTALRSEAQVARMGGDEIYVGIVLDPDRSGAPMGQERRTASISDVVDYAYRSIALLEADLNADWPNTGLGISMGVAISDPDHFEPVKDLLKLADKGMYRYKEARKAGRNKPAIIKPRAAPEDGAVLPALPLITSTSEAA